MERLQEIMSSLSSAQKERIFLYFFQGMMMYDLAKMAMEKQIPMFFNVNETDGITVKLGENNYSTK